MNEEGQKVWREAPESRCEGDIPKCAAGEQRNGLEDWLFINRIRGLLSGPDKFEPFKFEIRGSPVPAQNAGLEGFLYTWVDLERFGLQTHHQLNYFFSYAQALFRAAGFPEEAEGLEDLQRQALNLEQKSMALKRRLWKFASRCRRLIEAQDKARWIREGCSYQIFLRAFNLAEHRALANVGNPRLSEKLFKDVSPSDLPKVQSIRWTGTFPIGRVDMKGEAGGSPFSIRSMSRIDAAHGGDLQCARKLNEMRFHGLHNIFELVLNHTAIDADMVEEDPEMYIHTCRDPGNTQGYHRIIHRRSAKEYWIRLGGYRYSGTRHYWEDTLQLDLSNPKTRQTLIAAVRGLVEIFDINGFRVDMAYQMLHKAFIETWGSEPAYSLSNRIEDEFVAELIREIKTSHPHIGFIAEAFESWERLSAAGFDVIYGQNQMDLSGGLRHVGWYDALRSGDAWLITEAIKRVAFLHWQCGGAGMLAYIGHHDLPSPIRVFGNLVYAAAFLTLLLPSAHNWYAGTEVGFEEPCDENDKMISFNRYARIRWRGTNDVFYRFVMQCFERASDVRNELGQVGIVPLWAEDGMKWVGYFLRPRDRMRQMNYGGALVLANLSEQETTVCIRRPDVGIDSFHCVLGKAGLGGQELIWIDPRKTAHIR